MKKLLSCLAIVAMALTLFAETSTPKGFTDDFDAALKAANAPGGKPIYAVFSGSDWCYWCKVLEQGYLSKPEFVKQASQDFQLVFIDSPRDKSLLSEKAKTRNRELTKEYKIRGFPTPLFIKADGTAKPAPRPWQDMSAEDYGKSLKAAFEK